MRLVCCHRPILQELASLAKQDLLRFELDPKPTLAFQV